MQNQKIGNIASILADLEPKLNTLKDEKIFPIVREFFDELKKCDTSKCKYACAFLIGAILEQLFYGYYKKHYSSQE